MTSKFAIAAAAALVALTSAASAAGVSFSDSQRDLQLRAQALKPVSQGTVEITRPAIDPAYSQRDVQLQAQADQNSGTILTTHGNVVVATPSNANGVDFALGSNR